MAVLDIQRRGQQIGRIRIGQLVKAESGNMRPDRLETFRFTTQSKPTADAIAALYGGTVRDWEGEYEVITRESSIGVTVPPRDQVVSQFYEMWSKGGCQRRCDSQTEQITGKPCLCPHASDPADEDDVARKAIERSVLASQNPPKACKLVTRISVMLPDLPGLGVFRLDTGSYYAGVEIGDAAALMELARDRGVFLPANLRIEQRSRVADGKTKKYPVPVLEVLATFRQIASGELEAGGIRAQLPPAPGERPKAITAAPAQPPDVPRPVPDEGGIQRDDPGKHALTGPGHPSDAGQDPEHVLACRIAADALNASTRAQVGRLAAEATAGAVIDVYVLTDEDNDVWEPLGEYLRGLWRTKSRASA